MRPSTAFLLLVALGLMGLTIIGVQASRDKPAQEKFVQRMRNLVIAYGLTDLCLFTEARYTRHPSVADMHSAFQDHPGALDHFPSGSLILPPPHFQKPLWSPLIPVLPFDSHEDPQRDDSEGMSTSGPKTSSSRVASGIFLAPGRAQR